MQNEFRIYTTRVKICCISSLHEAELAIRYGAHSIGLVSEMPSGPGVIPEERIAEIAAATPPGVTSTLLTSRSSATGIISQQRRVAVNAIQICDRLAEGTHQQIREALPGVALVQVIHVVGESSIKEAIDIAPHVDAILLDSGNPDQAVKELGGTGRCHDWDLSKRIRDAVDIPIFLAGGLNAGNAAAAIENLKPYALDVCSGVRTNGKLDEGKLAAFMDAVRSRNTTKVWRF
ncbi:MAG: phosphoribosylanthranilate isomerase [candidate division KSB1 bacterium]|jgi:phosphoribosylanthranilate isomerase|nr:phosphoribosylanthranilate isomerase [candidate division KSB1 bacterium]